MPTAESLSRSPLVAAPAAGRYPSPTAGSLVKIRTRGREPAYFCVGDNLNDMRLVASYVGQRQPVYGLLLGELKKLQPYHNSLTTIAEELVWQMRHVQPQGPYHLCGYAESIVLTLEVADQLRRQGQKIATMVVFHALPPAKGSWFMRLFTRR